MHGYARRPSSPRRPGRSALLLLAICSSLVMTPSNAQEDSRLGRVSFPNSGSAEAQEAFLGGLAALHSFFYDEAADLFREAQEIDPSFAMAYWGEAMTHNHPLWHQVDLGAARAALERLGEDAAARAAKAPTAREKAYLGTVEALFGEGDKKERDQAYSTALERLTEEYPDDPEAAAFYSLSLQGLMPPGGRDARLAMRSAAIVEELFDDNPLHPGAAHYLIHAYDDPIHAPLGLRAARVYAEIAPAAHHALHMPSHIFVQLGMWERAAASNEDAYQASVTWVEERGHSLTMRDFHSLSWLQYAYLQLGRVKDAAGTLDTIRGVAVSTEDGRTRAGWNGMRARQVVETGGKAEMPWPETTETAGHHNSRAVALFGAAFGAARRGDAESLRRGEKAMGELAEKTTDYRGKALAVMHAQLQGLAAQLDGREKKALEHFAKAADLEARMPAPSGPPMPIKPAHELYGEALLAAGRHSQAAQQFEASLLRTPDRVASLLGAARSAVAAGDRATATQIYGKLVALWHGADADFPPLEEAQSYLTKIPREGDES